jgi:diacylglycerol kinase (ATP)
MLPAVRAAFAAHGITDIWTTERAGDEATLVHRALDAGATTIVAVGGDGTWGKCAAALAESAVDARIAFVQGGTGNDFAKNLPAPARDLHAMARLVAGPCTEWRVDMGRIESGGRGDWFLNVAGVGFDVAVLLDTMKGSALSGNAVYIAAAVRNLLRYDGLDLTNAAIATGPQRAMMVVFSNGLNFGGAFRIAPAARVDDGEIDCVQIGDIRGVARIPLFARALRGSHLSHPEVRTARAASFPLSFPEPPAFEADGELVRTADVEVVVRTVPGALRVLAAPV